MRGHHIGLVPNISYLIYTDYDYRSSFQENRTQVTLLPDTILKLVVYVIK